MAAGLPASSSDHQIWTAQHKARPTAYYNWGRYEKGRELSRGGKIHDVFLADCGAGEECAPGDPLDEKTQMGAMVDATKQRVLGCESAKGARRPSAAIRCARSRASFPTLRSRPRTAQTRGVLPVLSTYSQEREEAVACQ